MSQFRKLNAKNEYTGEDKITVIDGIKLAEKQCDELRDNLQRLWQILASNAQTVLYAINPHHTADASGEGQSCLRPQVSRYQSAQCIIEPVITGQYLRGKGQSKNDFEGSLPTTRHQAKIKLGTYAMDNETLDGGPGSHVITLFKKQDTKCSLLELKNPGHLLARRPAESTNIGEGNVNLEQSKIKHPLPFIAGTSTSQSHNICLNIQEVLAKMKRSQPQVMGPMGDSKENEPAITRNNMLSVSGGDVEKQATLALPDELRTQKFKQVLKNLYKEFAAMSKEYEKLMDAYNSKESNTTFYKKQLKKLDSILAKKEDEIVILISMYRQVMSMKEEVSRSNEKVTRAPRNRLLSNTTNLRLKILLKQMRKLQSNLNQT